MYDNGWKHSKLYNKIFKTIVFMVVFNMNKKKKIQPFKSLIMKTSIPPLSFIVSCI